MVWYYSMHYLSNSLTWQWSYSIQVLYGHRWEIMRSWSCLQYYFLYYKYQLLCKQSLSPSTVHTDWIQGKETVCRNSTLHVTFTRVESALTYLNNSVSVWTVSIVWLDLISEIQWSYGWPCRKVNNGRFYHAKVYLLYSVDERNQ